jgi:hypothetical protein
LIKPLFQIIQVRFARWQYHRLIADNRHAKIAQDIVNRVGNGNAAAAGK